MKRFFWAATAAMLLAPAAVRAQDAKAKGILEAASKKMSGLRTLKTGFVLTTVGAGGKVRDTKKGTFLLKGQKYHITFTGQEIISDGTTVWTYMRAANEVQISAYNPTEQTISPAKLFTGFYDKEYSYRYSGTRTVGGKSCSIVTLTPLSAGKQFTRVELAIDNSNTIAGGNIFEPNGNQYQYEVNGFTANAALADSQFSFDAKAHPGVDVVDLR